MAKQPFIAACLLFQALLLQAQKEETLFGNTHTRGGFGGVYTIYSRADSDPGNGAGFDGGFILNDVSLGGYFQAEFFGRRHGVYDDYNLNLSSIGFLVGYAYPSRKVIHFYTTLKVGAGTAVLARRDNNPFNNQNDYTDGISTVAPELGAEVNLAHWIRLALTGGYRWVYDVDNLLGFDNSDFNSSFISLKLRLGAFGYRSK